MENKNLDADSRFIATILHEIRTPIQTIISTIELLEDTNLTKTQNDYLRQLDFSAETLLQLANDVLDFTKLNSGEYKLENIPYDITELTENVVDLVTIEAFNKGLEIITDIDYSVPQMIMGDQKRVQEIILNLVKNAVKFTENGFILVRVKQVNSYLLFEIIDTGIGIPENKREEVFKDFYQVDGSSTKKYSGTGLGLGICKKLVSVMKGKIGVLANPSGGSNFWFAIPLEISTLNTEELKIKNIDDSVKVLIIDDNTTALDSLCKKFIHYGITNLQKCTTLTSAMEKLSQGIDDSAPFTHVFIDKDLKDGDGWIIAEQIKANENLKSCKLYMMVNEGQISKDERDRISSLFEDSIYKPIKRKDFEEIIFREFSPELLKNKTELQTMIKIQQPDSEFNSIKVLVAEDHPVNRQLLNILLSKMNVTVLTAENGQVAIDTIHQNPDIEIIFMDIFMPVKNGLDAAIELRHEGYKGIIIACTANNNPEDFNIYTQKGFNDILTKPFRKETIKKLLAKWNEVLKVPEVKDMLTLVDSNNLLNELWDATDFLDTTNGSKDSAVSLMEQYIEITTEMLKEIKHELNASPVDFIKLRNLTHKLAGSSGQVSSKKLYDYAVKMNKAANDEDSIAIEAIRVDFALDFMNLKDFVETWKTTK